MSRPLVVDPADYRDVPGVVVVDELEAQRISRWEHPPLVRSLRRRFEAVLSAGAE